MKSKEQAVYQVMASKKVELGEQGVGMWRKGSIPGRRKYVQGPVSRWWQ